MPNVFKPVFEEGERPEGFRSRRARIGYELGTELIGKAIRFHLGEEGAHQIFNPTDQPATFLAVSSHGRPDVVVYPDADKIGVGERLPEGGALRVFFRCDDAVDYFDGESPPGG